MTGPNDQPQYQMPRTKPVEPTNACVNMTYDPGPITPAERTAARSYIDSVGGLKRAMEVLRHMQPAEAKTPKE